LKRTVETHKSHYHVSDQLQFVVKYYGRPKEVDEPPNKDKHILSYYSLKNLSMNRTQIKNSVSRIEGHARVKAIASLTRREVRSHLMKTNSMLTAYWDENQREVPPNPEVHLRNFADLIGCFKLEEAGDERNT
jgi:hypothetical protein